jgi:hypothetical protein
MNRTIFLSQSIDHLIPFIGCLLLVVLTPLSLGAPPQLFFPPSPFYLVASIVGALFVSSLCYRTLCLIVLGQTVGTQLFSLRPRDERNTRDLVLAHVWEALCLALPPLWALEIISRFQGKHIGFDYVFCYKNPS